MEVSCPQMDSEDWLGIKGDGIKLEMKQKMRWNKTVK